MNTETALLGAAFGIYLLIVLIIGVYGYRRTRDITDYLLAGRQLGRWVTALSAGASDMSGWLLLGLPGYAYLAGFEAGWIALGLLIGTLLNWILVAGRLRSASEAAGNALTLPEFFQRRFGQDRHYLRLLCGLMILVFFLFYTSAGLVAAGKLFEAVFAMPYGWAVCLGTLTVMLYTLFGGFLAVAWTDLLQGLLMLTALVGVALLACSRLGGWDGLILDLEQVNPNLGNPWKNRDGAPLGTLAIVSLLGWGLGYFGQPHIQVRFMATRSRALIGPARRIAVTWTTLCMAAALIIGLAGHGLITPPLTGADSEKVFIILVELLFHPAVAGLCLAAILAAIMSTIDSQLLIASSALTEDLYSLLPKSTRLTTVQRIWVGRSGVLIIAILAMWLALEPERQVLDLIAYAWAGFGAAFGPTLLLALYWPRMNGPAAMTGILTGGLTVLIWPQFQGGWFELYELVPGFCLSFLACLSIGWWSGGKHETLRRRIS